MTGLTKKTASGRIAWLDSLRGLTISLVIFHHALTYMEVGTSAFDNTPLSWPIGFANQALGLIRMPAFFFCSGMLFERTMHRGWGWFLRERLSFAVWVILIWTFLSFVTLELGLQLYPLDSSTTGHAPWNMFFWSPYGNMWFLYAIAILGAFATGLRAFNGKLKLLIAALVSISMMALYEHISFTSGLKTLYYNLGSRGILFFMLGIVLAQPARASTKPGCTAAIAAFVFLMGSFAAVKLGLINSVWIRMAAALPATFAGLLLFRFLIEISQRLNRFVAALGKRSLELFVLHQFAIAIAYRVLADFDWPFGPELSLSIVFSFAIVSSYATAMLLRRAPRNLFFSNPISFESGKRLLIRP